jgi:Ca2+:H+ antiporter
LGLTALSLLIPAAFSATTGSVTKETIDSGIINLSHGTAIILLIVYVLYLVFQLKTHSELVKQITHFVYLGNL